VLVSTTACHQSFGADDVSKIVIKKYFHYLTVCRVSPTLFFIKLGPQIVAAATFADSA
jgi:hypothetical protein